MNHPLELWRGFPRDLLGFQKEMDRLFEGVLPPATQRSGMPTAPVMEAEETDSHFKVSFDVPGMKREEIKVEVHDNLLQVSGERRQETTSEREGKRYTEKTYGSFRRTVTLPGAVDSERVEAEYRDGVLRLTLPKKTRPGARQISVK